MIHVPGLENYFGGKGASGTYQTIINHIPPHNIYIEPFLGGGSIMKYKKPADVLNWGMDIDPAVIEFWNRARLPENFKISEGDALLMLHALKNEDHPFYNNWGFKGHEVFIYIDPPYLLSSRKCPRKQYRHELNEADHVKLLKTVKQFNCFDIAISCYENNLYKEYLKDWNYITFESQTRRGKATEFLYMNYAEPKELHDYNFLGTDYRERERIKNKIKRHVQGLKRLPELERKAILNTFRNEFQISNH